MHANNSLFGRLFQTGLSVTDWQEQGCVAAVRELQREFASRSDTELREESQNLRALVVAQSPDIPALRARAFALMTEALRRRCGVTLYDVQLQASATLVRGGVAEMQTGEGKTFACAPATYLLGLTGLGVHVVNPNAYLAQRDFSQLAPAYEMLGASAGLLRDGDTPTAKRAAYLSDVTYGTGYEFGFDFLRDRLAERSEVARGLGESILNHLRGGESPTQLAVVQRPLHAAIIDEVDNVLLDEAGSPLMISGPVAQLAADAEAHRLALDVVADLGRDRDYRLDAATGFLQLTDTGMERIHASHWRIPLSLLVRTWAEYVELAIRARFLLFRDVHYVVDDQRVQIVDGCTGRIFSDRTWQDGLHQAVEAKEGIPITADRVPLAQITRQRYYRLYQRLCGMTGTAAGCEREFQGVYKLQVNPIPLRVPSRREIWPTRFFDCAAAKCRGIAQSVLDLLSAGRPVLVGTRSILDSERLAASFRDHWIEFALLNGRQDEEEAAIVARAGQPDAVTIATDLAGRGTDIRLGPGVAERGGLHVILAECHDSARVDRQLIGRCARQGDPGSAQMFVSAEDSLIQRSGPWLGEWMGQYGNRDGEVTLDLTGQLRRLQRMVERRDFANRCALQRRDLARDSLLLRSQGKM
jgi:preprotein translocase subunit SecA